MATFLPILGGILTVAAKLGEYLVPTIKRQFNYMCCYSSNIEDLQKQVQKLVLVEDVIQLQVDAGKRNLETIGPDVENWFAEVEKIKKKTAKLCEDTAKVSEGCICGRCPNLKMRYLLSRRAKKITKKLVQLQNDGKFGKVSYPVHIGMMDFPDPPSESSNNDTSFTEKEAAPIESDNKFRTRKSAEEKIMASLLDCDVKMIGLCGMGGVGKTTMVKRIGRILKGNKLFDEVVMAVVTQQPDTKKIQSEIAEILNLKLEGESVFNRGTLLHRRILGAKRILIILDDIWKRLDLESIGIPLTTTNCTCKILLTSRAQDICVQMGAEKILQLEVLSRDEAWILFSDEAGISRDSPRVNQIAKEVANECKGLPIALVTVARALKKKSISTWENALTQLKRSIPTNILGVTEDVYLPLELSYSTLEGDEVKNLFLLCSLFQEGTNICMESLVRFGIGLNVFERIKNLREGRIRTSALVEILQDRFLLLDGHKEGYVRMHDVIRDVAISIASKERLKFLVHNDDTDGQWLLRNLKLPCTHISLISIYTDLIEEMNCPNLVFLSWESKCKIFKGLKCTFERCRKLNVLDLHHMDIPTSPSIQKLTDLKVLHLCSCKLESISMIGDLINLEILTFRGSEFQILPAAIGKLTNLRLLDLTDCETLQKIEQGAIAGLVQLEELYLTKSYVAWEEVKKGNTENSAGLTELEQLSNLTTLRILIANRKVISRNIRFSSELARYDISIQAVPECLINYHTSKAHVPINYQYPFQKVMDLYLPTKTQLGEWISALLKITEDIRLHGDGSNIVVHELGSGGFQYLKQLGIQDCNTVEHLASSLSEDPQSLDVFPMLETLYLHQLPNIKEICIGQLSARSFRELRYLHLQELKELRRFWSCPTTYVSLSNLRSIYIYKCQNLKSLFSISVAQSLFQLEELDISDCKMMEKVFFNETGQDIITTCNIEFRKIEKLVLRCLHSLTNFCTEIDRISFPQLKVLKMEDLKQFQGFCPTKSSSISSDDNETDRQTILNAKVECPRIKILSLHLVGMAKIFCHQPPPCFLRELEFLEVDSCHGLTSIFSPSVAQALVKLKELRIRDCRALIEVVEKENEIQKKENTTPSSSNKINGLFHQLEYLELDTCNKLENVFSPTTVNGLQNLKELRIRNCKMLTEETEIPMRKSTAKTTESVERISRPHYLEEQSHETDYASYKSHGTDYASCKSHGTDYASCKSHICNHGEEQRDGDKFESR